MTCYSSVGPSIVPPYTPPFVGLPVIRAESTGQSLGSEVFLFFSFPLLSY